MRIASRLLATLGLTAVAALAGAPSASAHPVACSVSNAHWQDAAKGRIKDLAKGLRPGSPGVQCGTRGPKVMVFKIVGPCRVWFQTVTVRKEDNIPIPTNFGVVYIRWSATYSTTGLVSIGLGRCR